MVEGLSTGRDDSSSVRRELGGINSNGDWSLFDGSLEVGIVGRDVLVSSDWSVSLGVVSSTLLVDGLVWVLRL